MNTAELIAKLKAADEGSRDLDAQVCEVVHSSLIADCQPDLEKGHGHWIHPTAGPTYAMDYTTSIDAALQLLAPGSYWTVKDDGSAFVGHRESDHDGHTAHAATPALALCIAALLAREA